MQQLYMYLEEKKDEKTFANYELMALIHNCLSGAYKLPLNQDGVRFESWFILT